MAKFLGIFVAFLLLSPAIFAEERSIMGEPIILRPSLYEQLLALVLFIVPFFLDLFIFSNHKEIFGNSKLTHKPLLLIATLLANAFCSFMLYHFYKTFWH